MCILLHAWCRQGLRSLYCTKGLGGTFQALNLWQSSVSQEGKGDVGGGVPRPFLNKAFGLRLGCPVIHGLWLAIGTGQGNKDGMGIFSYKRFFMKLQWSNLWLSRCELPQEELREDKAQSFLIWWESHCVVWLLFSIGCNVSRTGNDLCSVYVGCKTSLEKVKLRTCPTAKNH